jgi:excisionase family DNA binding protein
MKEVFRTGEVARICNVCARTVSNWIDRGLLGGYVVPGTKHRRIPRQNLLRFMQEHGMPLGELAEHPVTAN